MSVVILPNGKLDVRCDLPGGCQNHWSVVNEPQAMKAAEEQLSRWGWRSIRRFHFCPMHVSRVAEFEPDEKVLERRRQDIRHRQAHIGA